MKYILIVLLVLFFSFLGYGSYLNSEIAKSGDKWIGIGVLIIAFGIMPLFILHRYKKSKLKEFLNSQLDKNREKSENQ
ncbi:hypothetical protein GOQ30_13430 [Flavobacterium sp. TP390]|uniref:Isoleucyl-tRNA synthetase n=1 Tax=Flavobacterium profundi TaxID=1774945 RepID=A0A6I4ITT8_9FLAO|nr:hypothetical protein [Flavobacterium profundi]MVO10168.1 hypothetical protein [Flavobacterium profundi]